MNHWLKERRRKELDKLLKRLKQAKDWPGAAIWYNGDTQRQDWWSMRPQTSGAGMGVQKGLYGFRIES